MNTENLDTMIRKAAASALSEWYSDQWSIQTEAIEDLVQELWVWYLERPGTRKQLDEADEFLGRRLIYRAAMQTLARDALGEDVFDGRVLYSSDAVKEALRGESTNVYLNQILPFAVQNLANRNEDQAEAIRSRYEDNAVPEQGSHYVLVRAVKSLTEEVNVIFLTSNNDGVGSRASVFPDSIRRSGGYSDPTGDTVVLLEQSPEVRNSYLEDADLSHVLEGEHAEPAYDLVERIRFRPTGDDADRLVEDPGMVESYLDNVRSRTGLAAC